MVSSKINILLADDDKDDCMFFQEALEELQLSTQLTAIHDGDQLMQLLTKKSGGFYDVLFLDLNMPRKNGFTCLTGIKRSEKLRSLPVIIFSTSYDESMADLLYKNGAQHFIRKPADFSQLKIVIHQAIKLVSEKNIPQPSRENFLLNKLKTLSPLNENNFAPK